jgi:hypothetical protein
MDKAGKHYAKWKKPGTKEHVLLRKFIETQSKLLDAGEIGGKWGGSFFLR